ncbi:ribonuclease H-like protein [Leucogyrophana mollusca]|uniref:Ribonuclease H-like protein n=1 Tax=Leucogyrophana mollusca TaxID=85980 RepID=A0ACB8AZ13_9AGAM|nr:ribonuclease H-like protein [Leucogyrophana mollusca]
MFSLPNTFDGSCKNNGKQNAICGSGIWFRLNDNRNTQVRIPGLRQSNQAGEIAALIIAAQIYSKYVISGLTKHIQFWEDMGWIGIQNRNLFEAAAYQLRKRAAQTTLKWIKGHSGDEGNKGADALANQGVQTPIPDNIDITIPTHFKPVQGAKLQAMTQSIAYQGIRETIITTPRRSSIINLDITRFAINAITETWETDEKIWKSCKLKPLTQTQVNSYSECFKDPHAEESMDHTLPECTQNGQNEIWSQAKDLWNNKNINWPTINLGTIMGCGLINLATPKNQNAPRNPHEESKTKGNSRLLKILISKSAHLIWATRYKHHKKQEILTQHTWTGTIQNELDLPQDWVTTREVLVGLKPPRPSPQEATRRLESPTLP